jgi:DNA-binding transcriptional MerR regulator
MATHSVAFLSADVLAETGVTPSYLAFLIREGVVRPAKYRNGRTNLFTESDIERVRWAVANRGRYSVHEMRQRLSAENAA